MVKLKFLLKKLILSLGYSLLNMNITKRSDDPFIIINKLLPDFDTKLIVDAGASIGETSKKLSKFFPKAKIHAIEPFPKFYHILEENCKKNANITPYNFALSDVEGTVSLNINKSEIYEYFYMQYYHFDHKDYKNKFEENFITKKFYNKSNEYKINFHNSSKYFNYIINLQKKKNIKKKLENYFSEYLSKNRIA